MGRDNKQKLELAKKMAEKINARKGDGKQSESQATAEAVMKGLAVKPAAAPTVSNKLLADQIAAKLNAKLGHVPMDRNETEQQAQVSFRDHKYFGDFGQDKAPVVTYLKKYFQNLEGMYQTQYEEELEINDFPQSCRWKVTSREAIGNITDFSEADIQIRGVYYPPGKEPGEGMFRNITVITSRSSSAVQKWATKNGPF